MLNPNNSFKKPKDPMKRLNSMKNNYNLSNAFGGKIILGDSQTKTKIVDEPKQVKRKDSVQTPLKFDKSDDTNDFLTLSPDVIDHEMLSEYTLIYLLIFI